jgi:hypothetical protein
VDVRLGNADTIIHLRLEGDFGLPFVEPQESFALVFGYDRRHFLVAAKSSLEELVGTGAVHT